MRISKYNSEGYHDPTTYEAFRSIDKAQRESQLSSLAKRVPGYRPMVFICSPYAGEDCPANVKNARRYCRHAVDTGHIPFAPHLLFPQFLNDNNGDERRLGLDMGLAWMTKCAELWVFGDYISPGMEMEIKRAEQRCMRIRYFTADCQEV